MTIFNLPDLGEGLAEAEIREWYVKEGDIVQKEQPLVSVETAKAVVDVPSPHAGRIVKLYGKPGDIIQTGNPLIEFESSSESKDAGTVVGKLETGEKILKEAATGVQVSSSTESRLKVTPAVRQLAKALQVDLNTIKPTGAGGIISIEDVKQAATQTSPVTAGKPTPVYSEALHGARRSMAINMTEAQIILPVTLVDDADIHHWPKGTDITVRIIRAITEACQKEPSLNAHFDGKSLTRELFKEVNLGVAVDSKESLYVAVIKNAAQCSDQQLREKINYFKQCAEQQKFSPEDLQGASILLSNFGTIAGRYANPIVMPPTVAIVGIGKIKDAVVPDEKKQPAVHRIIPISLTFDHRAATGGEAARFLGTMIEALQK